MEDTVQDRSSSLWEDEDWDEMCDVTDWYRTRNEEVYCTPEVLHSEKNGWWPLDETELKDEQGQPRMKI